MTKAMQPNLNETAKLIKSRITEALIDARQSAGLSVDELARMIGSDSVTISLLEMGIGSIASLTLVMAVLNIRLSGIGAGPTIGHQLANRRAKDKLALEQVARKTGLSTETIESLEQCRGQVSDLFTLLAWLAPKVRRSGSRPSWGGGDPDSNSRFTPAWLMEAIYKAFGPVSLDPCGHRLSPVVADRRILLEEGGNGLIETWSGNLAFVNPPFSEQLDWLRKCYEEWSAGNVKTILFLAPAAPDNGFFQETLHRHADLFFLRGRPKFTKPDNHEEATKFSLWLVALGATTAQKNRFAELVRGLWVRTWEAASLTNPLSCAASDRTYRVLCCRH